MRSLEDLTSSVRIRASRVQFEEAVRSYSAGAYRSATVALWICLVLDLVEKLRILADAGDGAARKLIDEVTRAREAEDIQKMLNIEAGLLDRAFADFELITAREKVHLERLRQDRNLCAHPSFHGDGDEPYEMSAEQVRAHMSTVVDAVLAQPPVVGKALVDRFIADTKSASWPTDRLADYLRERYFGRARANGMRNILLLAVKSALRPPDGDNRIAGRCVATIAAASEFDRPRVVEAASDILTRWRDAMSEDDLLRTVGALGMFPEAWRALGPENAVRVGVLLSTVDSDALIEQRAFASGPPLEPDVAVKYGEAIARLEVRHLEILTGKPYPKEQWVGKVLEVVRSASTYRSGEEAMRMVLRVAEVLSLDDIKHLGAEFVRNSQIHHASDMPQILSRLVEATRRLPGATTAWKCAITEYRSSRYDPSTDPGAHYSYEDVLEEIEAAA